MLFTHAGARYAMGRAGGVRRLPECKERAIKWYVLLGIPALLLMIGVACSRSDVTATPTSTSTLGVTPTLAPTREPTPLPTPTPTPTLAPSLTVTATPTPKRTPSPIPSTNPEPTPPPEDASDREGLWAGEVGVSGLRESLPWLALRVVPGENPYVDAWRFEKGVTGLPGQRLEIVCVPERVNRGWELADCTGMKGQFEGARITVFVPAESETGLKVKISRGSFDVSVTLTRVPQREELQASANVATLWHEPGSGLHTDIWAADGLVYAPRFDGLIEILDGSTGRVVSVASLAGVAGGGPDAVLDVKASGRLLYAATVSNGLVVFDVSQPGVPRLIGQYRRFLGEGSPENFTNIHNIFLSPDASVVYAINHLFPEQPVSESAPGTDLRVIDVSDPTSPREAGRFFIDSDGGLVHDINVIELEGQLIAFLNYWDAGLWILDVTDPSSIDVLGSIDWDGITSHSGWPFAMDGKLYYAHAEEGYDQHLTVLDMTDLANPQIISRFRTRTGISTHNVEVANGIAYISYYIDGLRVVDLRDPENPREVGHFDTVAAEEERDLLQGAWGVRVLEGIVYISDMESGTYAFQVSLD